MVWYGMEVNFTKKIVNLPFQDWYFLRLKHNLPENNHFCDNSSKKIHSLENLLRYEVCWRGKYKLCLALSAKYSSIHYKTKHNCQPIL